ncbi:MAG: DUF45 domain-containing protein [Bacteroidales bacterium]|nr:DUF45 domain-containing protein [Bacteroidales bacterium]
MQEKIYSDEAAGPVVLRKSARARRLSIRVHPEKGVTVTIPWPVRYETGLAFFRERREWVLDALERQRKRLSTLDTELPEGETVETLRRKAKAYLPGRLAALAERYGFRYGRVTIKHNASNWGSCSTRGNINLNLNLMRLPVPLQDYVLLHELTHLHHPDHGMGFHVELERLLADHFAAHLEDPAFRACLPAIGATRARYRITHVLEKEVRRYRLR